MPALARLLARRPPVAIQWGLERIRFMLDGLARPERTFTSIHVAGTNGKGTAAATVESILRHAGMRTGLYTSPHLVAFSERIRIGGRPAAPDVMEAVAADVLPLAEECEATFFEATTALGFGCFARAAVEVAVVEVGLGGRLDATNVLEAPVCMITSIDLDHSDYLGEDVAAIAAEKAGIIARGSAVAVGDLPEAAESVVLGAAAAAGATTWNAGHDFVVESDGGYRAVFRGGPCDRRLELNSPFFGPQQATNVGLAVVAADLLMASETDSRDAVLTDELVKRAVASVELPGRFDVRGGPAGRWIYDIAHNPAAAKALAAGLTEASPGRPLVLLASVLGDKDWPDVLAPLLGVTDGAVLTVAPSSPPARRWDLNAVRARLAPVTPGGPAIDIDPDFGSALARARDRAGVEGTVVVTGSAFTVGDALRWNDAGVP